MPENRTLTAFQTVSQALVVSAGLLYLLGFFIISVFDARYGIADFALFRPKVIAVGALFILLASLAMFLGFKMLSLFAPEVEGRRDGSGLVETPPERPLVTTSFAILPLGFVGLTYVLGFLFSSFPKWSGIGPKLFILTAALIGAILVLGRKWRITHPTLFMFLSILGFGVPFQIMHRYAEPALFWFVTWLSAVSLISIYISLKMRKRAKVREIEWEIMFVAMVWVPIVFFNYATKIYPRIRHEFGGGAPVPVVLHLTKKLPEFDSASVPVSLIDETEQGYYVLRGSDKAVFVARALVEEVEFLKEQHSQYLWSKPD